MLGEGHPHVTGFVSTSISEESASGSLPRSEQPPTWLSALLRRVTLSLHPLSF